MDSEKCVEKIIGKPKKFDSEKVVEGMVGKQKEKKWEDIDRD